MLDSSSWIQQTSQKLVGNAFVPLAPKIYQLEGFKYAVRRTRFEISKFGMAETFFTFAEIPNLTMDVLRQFSNASYQFAVANKKIPLPSGLFESVFCFAVAITADLNPQIAEVVRYTAPLAHWSAFELTVVYDLTNGGLYYFEKTPIWGAAYYAEFRREIQANLT